MPTNTLSLTTIGADVPVCVDPRARRMRGIGELLSAPLTMLQEKDGKVRDTLKYEVLVVDEKKAKVEVLATGLPASPVYANLDF